MVTNDIFLLLVKQQMMVTGILEVSNTIICTSVLDASRENISELCFRNRDFLLIRIWSFSLFLEEKKYNHSMQPTIKELEEKYNKMRDDQILDLLEDE